MNDRNPNKISHLVPHEEPPSLAADESPVPTDGSASHCPTAALPPERGPFADPIPQQLGRYRIIRLLGVGAFGRVFLADDPQLGRQVAIKVPKSALSELGISLESFLAEARHAAQLKHPAIVAVYDVQQAPPSPFIVQEFIAGVDLAAWKAQIRPSHDQVARLLIEVCEALSFAHRRGLVHRDLKPSNILVDGDGHAHVVDFGLAVHETEQCARRGEVSGTVPYMSPEQVLGETHRLDGRSDIWSIGVILYELLTGRRPFLATGLYNLITDIKTLEPRPPRQLDPSLPAELERICLRCLEKRREDRYTSASDLADDLRDWMDNPRTTGSPKITPAADSRVGVACEGPPKIVPKGLRSFDEHDADFFLELVPGPRDRQGLAQSLRYWKSRIEETDPDKTFTVGLIYGRSGCGKSSLIKAGLLPRLDPRVLTLYLEAAPDGTELQLLKRLQKQFNIDSSESSLPELMRRLRVHGMPGNRKLLVILDQFEQWLHARANDPHSELVSALRHCDGGRIQALVLVRSDFSDAVHSFFRRLEVRLQEDVNYALVELFDTHHAQRVLTAFGRAYGTLPTDPSPLTEEQETFVRQSVQELSEDDRVVCVRLAIFAQLMRSRIWTPLSLRHVGGAKGVGTTFLEESFCSATAPPEHRFHQHAARAVLKALLPASTADLKGSVRSYDDLLQQSGYVRRPSDFEDLITILDGELRLITPTGDEAVGDEVVDSGGWVAGGDEIEEAGGGKDGAKEALDGKAPGAQRSPYVPGATPTNLAPAPHPGSPAPYPPPSTRNYQLTHDYLVPSLREWLSRKQKETRRGRAENCLEERSALWSAKPDNRYLPAWWEDLNIRARVPRRYWTEPQRKMMRRSALFYGSRAAVAALLMYFVTGAAVDYRNVASSTRARERVNALLQAHIDEVPHIVEQTTQLRRWTTPLLEEQLLMAEDNSREKLHLSLALVANDPGQVAYLCSQLMNAEPDQFRVILDALTRYSQELVTKLQAQLEKRLEPQWSDRPLPFGTSSSVDAVFKSKIETAQGMIADRFAFCLAMPWHEFEAVCRELQPSGYFPTRIRPWLQGESSQEAAKRPEAGGPSGILVAAIWNRDPNAAVAAAALRERAVARFHAREDPGAIEDFTAVLKNDSADTEVYRLRAIANARLGDNGSAARDVALFQQHTSEPSHGAYLDAVVASWQGDTTGLEILDAKLEQHAEDQTWQYSAACAYAVAVRAFASVPDRAAQFADRAVELLLRATNDSQPDELWDIVHDYDLDALHTRPEFQELVARARCPLVSTMMEQASSSFDIDTLTSVSLPSHLEQCRRLYRAGYRPDAIFVTPRTTPLEPSSSGLQRQVSSLQPQFSSVWRRPIIAGNEKVAFARRRANAVTALLRRGEFNRALEALRVDHDAESLTQFVLGCRGRGVTPKELWDGVQIVSRRRQDLQGDARRVEDGVLYGLLLALGEFPFQELPSELRTGVVQQVTDWHASDASSAVHGVTGWLLRRWQQIPNEQETPEEERPKREWFTLTIRAGDREFAQTYVVFPAGEYQIGSALAERDGSTDETRHSFQRTLRIQRPFAILDREITRAEFEASGQSVPINEHYCPTGDYPMVGTSWNDGVRFCRWLTTAIGMSEDEQVYLDPGAQGADDGQPANWPFNPEKRGFRLPTEAEWEIAARAGMRSPFGFGHDLRFLKHYGWYAENSGGKPNLPRQLRPNFRGLFDMHGNMNEWCHDWYASQDPFESNNLPLFGPDSGDYRILRGGSWNHHAALARTDRREANSPADRSINTGLRVVVTP